MINVEELLQPVSPEKPVGEDVTYDAAMQELETALQGKPETQFSAAEEPNWKELVSQSTDLLKRSKHLRAMLTLTLGLLKTEGLIGFRDGFSLLHKSVEQYWADLYPVMDPDDNNDPTERVNIMAAMLTASGPAFDDPIQFHRRLKQAPLTASNRVGKFGYYDLPGTVSDVDGHQKPDSSQVEAAFRDTSPEALEAIHTAITDSIGYAQAMDKFLTSAIGNNNAPDWHPLISLLKDLKKAVVPYLPQGAVEPEPGEEGEMAAGGGGGAAAVSAPGTISSRQDVVRALDRICAYYEKAEPTSPVPLLLKRAQRLAEMNFLEIINDLSPEAIAHINLVAGIKPE